MNIHEYQAKKLFRSFGIPVPVGGVARTSEDQNLKLNIEKTILYIL